jgi:DNA/RNA-binding domain of Phe-tRNA-synthetase-like protein
MYFCHSSEIWQNFPELVAGSVFAEGITKDASVGPQIARFNAIAQSRLATSSEGQLLELQAWWRVFSRIGLKPTHYRCARISAEPGPQFPRFLPYVPLCGKSSASC